MAKEPLFPHVPKSKAQGIVYSTGRELGQTEKNKYEVRIEFTWASTHGREVAWAEIEEYIRRNMKDLATVRSVSQVLSPKDAANRIAINER
jgi:hypothetical protein